MSVERFYDELAPFYHLIFPDWEASIRRQAEALEQGVPSSIESADLLTQLLMQHWLPDSAA